MFDDIDEPTGKRWIKLLVAVGIGIPILIEVVTFGSMVTHSVGPATGGAPATATDAPAGAVEGDAILPSTPPAERITAASVVTRNDGWQFRLTVAVNNTGTDDYALSLGPVTTRAGDTVTGRVSTGQLAPGEHRTVSGAWLLPKGQRPETIQVTTAGNGSRTVRFGDVPVTS